MLLSDDIRSLADQVLDRVDEAREFYVHSRQAWRLVQQLVQRPSGWDRRSGHQAALADWGSGVALRNT